MGAVFAVQVRTGFETRAKEMLKHVFLSSGESLVKSIYAHETHTEFINDKTEGVNTEDIVNEEDIASHLSKERYRSAINNRRLQLDAIDRYHTPEFESLKKQYRKEISELEREVTKIRSTSKRIHSVLSGYLLIELKWDSTYLPNHIWHLIKSIPLVQNILSTNPIPKEEMEQFISNIDDIVEPETVINFGKEIDYDKVDKITSDLLYEANKRDTTHEEKAEIFEKIDDSVLNVVEKVRDLLEDNKPVNNILSKVKAFIKRKTEMVSMPLHLLEKLYTEKELKFIGNLINGKDFLNRLQHLLNRQVVLEC